MKEAKINCRKRKVDLKKDQTNANKVSLQIKEQSNQIVDQLSAKKYHPNQNENQFKLRQNILFPTNHAFTYTVLYTNIMIQPE